MPNPSSEVRKIDELLSQYQREEQFVNFVQSPDYSDALRAAVPFLIEHWPTDEQIQQLNDRIRNPDRAPNQLEIGLIAKLRAGQSLDAIKNYNAQEVTPRDNAKIFWALSENRPWRDNTFNRWKDSVDDTFGKKLYLISRNEF